MGKAFCLVQGLTIVDAQILSAQRVSRREERPGGGIKGEAS